MRFQILAKKENFFQPTQFAATPLFFSGLASPQRTGGSFLFWEVSFLFLFLAKVNIQNGSNRAGLFVIRRSLQTRLSQTIHHTLIQLQRSPQTDPVAHTTRIVLSMQSAKARQAQ
jgi:hypothetical protein